MAEGEWLSISGAAAKLNEAGDLVERSTLSRYVKQHSEALGLRHEGGAVLVEMGVLVAHRAENVRMRKRTKRSNDASAAPAGRSRQTRFAGSQADGVARKAQADAEMREMDLAERRGHLTPVDEVNKSARDAVALMLSAFDRAVDGEAASASVRYGWDERVVRLVLKSFARKGTDVFHREVLRQLDAIAREEMAAAEGDETAVGAPLQ